MAAIALHTSVEAGRWTLDFPFQTLILKIRLSRSHFLMKSLSATSFFSLSHSLGAPSHLPYPASISRSISPPPVPRLGSAIPRSVPLLIFKFTHVTTPVATLVSCP